MHKTQKVQPQLVSSRKSWQPRSPIHVEVVIINPQMARQMLAHNAKNTRPISNYRKNLVIDAIQRGEWVISPDCIAFDENGNLLNGQHRLTAIIETGLSLMALVAYNLPEESFRVTDVGKTRDAGDLAAMVGFQKNSRIIGSAANLLYHYERGKLGIFDQAPTNTQLSELLCRHRGLEESASIGRSLRSILPRSVGAFCHYIFAQKNKIMAGLFFDALRTGENLSSGDPILVLRNRMQMEKLSKTALPHYEAIALVIKAWNYCRKGKKIKSLRWSHGGGEAFPVAL